MISGGVSLVLGLTLPVVQVPVPIAQAMRKRYRRDRIVSSNHVRGGSHAAAR